MKADQIIHGTLQKASIKDFLPETTVFPHSGRETMSKGEISRKLAQAIKRESCFLLQIRSILYE
mgnify:FL=1